MIWEVWEVEPLRRPRCVVEMKVITLIKDAVVVRKILEHPDLW